MAGRNIGLGRQAGTGVFLDGHELARTLPELDIAAMGTAVLLPQAIGELADALLMITAVGRSCIDHQATPCG
jgi:hypothetical protein